MIFLIGLVLLLLAVFILVFKRHTRARYFVILLTAFCVVFLSLIVAPFFAYGLHLEDPALVSMGQFDPKGYPLFNGTTEIGCWLHLGALLLITTAPVAVIALGGRLVLEMRHHAHEWQGTFRAITITTVLMSAALIAFYYSPLGRVITAWHAD